MFIAVVCRITHRVGYLYNLFGILLHRKFIYSTQFIYSLIKSFTSICSHRYLFSILGYNLILHYSSFGSWEFVPLALMFIQYTPIIVVFWAFSKFPAGSCLILVFLSLVLELAISPRSLAFFYWRFILEINICIQAVLVATVVSLLLGPQ